MALTKEEELELQALEAELSGLTPEEEEELAQLEAELGDKENTALESAARGAAQGITFGMQDEASAALEKGLTKLHNLFADNKIDEQTYEELRDAYRRENKQAQEENPGAYLGGEVAGSVASTFVPGMSALNVGKGAKLGTTLGKGALEGAISGYGYSEADNTKDLIKDIAFGSGTGGAFSSAGKYAGDVLDYAGTKGTDLAEGLYGQAKKMALNATGATGSQVSKFSDDAGEEILKRTKMFDTPEKLAGRISSEIDEVNLGLDKALAELDAEGVVVNKQAILDKLEKQINDMGKFASKADEKEKLLKIYDQVKETPKDMLPASFAEQEKRGFYGKAKRMYGDPDRGDALKGVGRAYKESVEEATKDYSPELAETFSTQKKKYGLLNPIKEASEKRALQQQQSPYGGLLDVATLGAGAVAVGQGEGTGYGALLFPFLRRKVSPRLPSTAAVGTKMLSEGIEKASNIFPSLGGLTRKAGDVGARINPEYLYSAERLSESTDPAASYYMYRQRLPKVNEE